MALSLGNMYNIMPTGSIEFNLEYTRVELQTAIKWVATAAKEETELVFGVGIFPDWTATAEQKTMDYLFIGRDEDQYIMLETAHTGSQNQNHRKHGRMGKIL